MQIFSSLAVILALGQFTSGAMIVLDCTNFPESCNNDCYGIYGPPRLPSSLTWDQPSSSVERNRRRGSGCTMSNGLSACNANSGVSPYNNDGPTCDEYPYASTSQGGMAGATLRCMSRSDNSAEGGHLRGNLYRKPIANGGCGNVAPCSFTVAVDMNTIGNSPLCSGANSGTSPLNDGHEFKKLSGGGYAAAKRELSDKDIYAPFPDGNGTFPMHLRREFLMSDGTRIMLLTTDLDMVIPSGLMVATSGDAKVVIRELLGQEKSPDLRPLVAASFVA
ncbi:hypothetical protein D6C97_08284 [Aureobasidium pullulans]|nr:hypothetical protein D6D08_08656 [Aureobasidium pullulans]THY46447.1 hypothetical protein D6C97_08284 [Aureobasidium pullulans]